MSTRSKETRRRGAMQPLAAVTPPTGGPPRLYQLARRARVAQALGPAVGPHLVDLRISASEIVLVFAGREWLGAFEFARNDLEAAVARVLARPGVAVRIECQENARGRADASRSRAEMAAAERATAARERLRDLARKLMPPQQK